MDIQTLGAQSIGRQLWPVSPTLTVAALVRSRQEDGLRSDLIIGRYYESTFPRVDNLVGLSRIRRYLSRRRFRAIRGSDVKCSCKAQVMSDEA